MPISFSDLPVNPFEDNIVAEPRKVEYTIPGLNEKPLEKVTAQFQRFEQEVLPRCLALKIRAQLITSADPGFGKSHLIGRLFRTVDKRATRIYLRPFQDAASSWRSILLKLVQELHRPDDPVRAAAVPGELTQLDAFAHGAMAHLLASLIESGKADCDDPEQRAKALRRDPVGSFGGGQQDHYLGEWMRKNFHGTLFPVLIKELQTVLDSNGMVLTARASTWLKVLFAYAYGDAIQRAACLEWIKGEGVSEVEAGLLHLDSTELPIVEDFAVGRNEVAERRLFDLLTLAGFYRPFLLCFDSTELMVAKPELCAEFGRIVATLVDYGPNVLIVVTANQSPWEKIWESIENAHHDRFTDPIHLQGLKTAQAEELAKKRLSDCNIAESEATRFFANDWLKQVFSGRPERGVRNFLKECARRCSELAGQEATQEETTLEDCFKHHLNEVLTKKERLEFDAEVLIWCLSDDVVANAMDGTKSESYNDQRGYFPIRWKQGQSKILLWGAEDSSHWRRWQAILRAARNHREDAAHNHKELQVIFLRTSEQSKIPGDGWIVLRPEFEQEAGWFSVRVLTKDEVQVVTAAYDLHANALGGNIPFSPTQVIEFVRQKLLPWWRRFIVGPSQAAELTPQQEGPPVVGLNEAIREVMVAQLFLSLPQLHTEISAFGAWTMEQVLTACQEFGEIKIFSTAQATALQWKS